MDKNCHHLALVRTGCILLRRVSYQVDGWNQRVRNRVQNGPLGITLALMYVMNRTLMRTRKNRQPSAAQGGFSLIEMMVVVLIMGIIAGLAITGYRGQLPTSRLRLVTTELHSTFNVARMMAMSQNATITVKLSGATETVTGTDVTVTSPITATIVRTSGGVDSQVTATTFHTEIVSIMVSPGIVSGTARPWVRFNSMGFRAGTGTQLLLLTNTQGRLHSISVAPGGKSKWCLKSTC